jgi:radical SAM superfamily enzyme YgiQ (UPF0313 family)
MKVLLVEPGYKNKYPPLGLMKISQYHKRMGHTVVFHKGLSPELRNQSWGRVYISTLFTFDWKCSVETIMYYKECTVDPKNVYVGGVMATLAAKDIKAETGIQPIEGLLDRPGMLGYSDNIIVDTLVPDYSILSQIDYTYPTSDAYITYMTRGCARKCGFCAVHRLEPTYKEYIPIRAQIQAIDEK